MFSQRRENERAFSIRRKAASFTNGQSRRQCYRETGRFCHPERSNCFAQRSGCGVEGPLPAQMAAARQGILPCSRRREFSATAHQPPGIRTGTTGYLGGNWRFPRSGVKWTSMGVSVGGRVHAANGPVAQVPAQLFWR